MAKFKTNIGTTCPYGEALCVRSVEELGEYIQQNAKELLGDITDVRRISFTFSLAVNEIPTLTVITQKYLREVGV